MAFLDFFKRNRPQGENEVRGMVQSDPRLLQLLGFGNMSEAGVSVTIDNALGVPAIFAAVNVISGTMASLPLHVYRRKGETRTRVRNSPLAKILAGAVNDELTSFDWRKHKFQQTTTGGRGLTYIERNGNGKVVNLWPLDPNDVTIKRKDLKTAYEYKPKGGKKIEYQAAEIIDIPFMRKADGVGHYSPILSNKDAIGLAIAVNKYGAKFFANGGVPPFAITGPFQSGGALDRAAKDLDDAVRKAASENRQALTLPGGLEVKPLGVDAEKAQMIETKRFAIEDIARIWGIPPVFLADLTNGTYSNTEQQDLAFVKHCIGQWVRQAEAELNLKFFGRTGGPNFVAFNLDGLLRGDFKTRMDGYARAINSAIMSPNEARQKENLPDAKGGDDLLIQGATVPLQHQSEQGSNENGSE